MKLGTFGTSIESIESINNEPNDPYGAYPLYGLQNLNESEYTILRDEIMRYDNFTYRLLCFETL